MTRRFIIAAIATVVFVAAAWGIYHRFILVEITFDEPAVDAAPPPAPPPVDAAVAEVPQVRVLRTVGTVEVAVNEAELAEAGLAEAGLAEAGLAEAELADGDRDGTAPGSWIVLAAGDTLKLGDWVRTGPDSAAVVDIAGTVLHIGEHTTLTVPEFRRVSEVRGQVTANVEPAEEVFVVGASQSDATASQDAGEFSLLSDGQGRVAVASKRGETVFRASGRTVVVPEGKASLATAGDGPSQPSDIPSSLFLKVARPGKAVRKKRFTLRGQSSPGALIRVDGELIRVGDDGTFQHVVVLREGRNELAVISTDVLGRRESQRVDVEVDSKRPKIDGRVRWR